MTPEEWKKGIQEWQQSGGREGSKAAPEAADDSGGGMLGSVGSFATGMAREGVSQLPGFLGGNSQFAKGGDQTPLSAEWMGRQATDLAPGVALDMFAPEVGIPALALSRGGRIVNELINAGTKGALGGAAATPSDRKSGSQTGAEVGAGSSAIGQVMSSRPVHRMLLPAAIVAEIAQHGGMIPHGALGGLYPWAMAHGLSALGGLARAAGFKAPATTGAIGSQVQQAIDNSQ